MAAFIQKLFKNRKTVSLESQKASEKPQSNQPTEEDNRQQLRQQQERQLGASPEPSALAALAIEGVTSAIRLQAASQLNQEEHLQAVLKQAKGRDKSVYQTVKQSLQILKEQQASEAATQHRITELVGQAQDQARSEDTKLYEARLNALQDHWQSVENKASAEQTQQFLQAVHQIRERQKQLDETRQEEQRHLDQKQQRQIGRAHV